MCEFELFFGSRNTLPVINHINLVRPQFRSPKPKLKRFKRQIRIPKKTVGLQKKAKMAFFYN